MYAAIDSICCAIDAPGSDPGPYSPRLLGRNCARLNAPDDGLSNFAPWLVSAASSAHQSAKFQPRCLLIWRIRSAPLPLADPPPATAASGPFAVLPNAWLSSACAAA